MSQSNHTGGGLEARFFYRTRESSSDGLKSKARPEMERQWGSEVKQSSVLQNISPNGQLLDMVCYCLLFVVAIHRWEGIRFSIYELNKGTSVYCEAEGQGPLRQAIVYYSNKSNKKEVKETASSMELELASLQHSPI